MTTPESKVKAKVKAVLNAYHVYYFMPVQMGLGAAGLDFHCVMKINAIPVAFFVETKAKGGKPSERQEQFIKDRWEQQRALTFVVNDDSSLKHLVDWLKAAMLKGTNT